MSYDPQVKHTTCIFDLTKFCIYWDCENIIPSKPKETMITGALSKRCKGSQNGNSDLTHHNSTAWYSSTHIYFKSYQEKLGRDSTNGKNTFSQTLANIKLNSKWLNHFKSREVSGDFSYHFYFAHS